MADQPVDLSARRRELAHRQGQEAHRRGDAFAFAPYTYNDDGFGTIESGEVIVLLDPEALTGIRMSKEDALRSAAALIQAALGPVEEEGPPPAAAR